MPALKINAKAGQTWNATDLLWCLLLPSANDAAVALAEKAGGGSLDGFVREMEQEAALLDLADRPVLRDPAGLDGAYSFDGGNYLSARDLAIAARAFLADPVLAGIVQQHEYRFHGGDGVDHVIRGHNTFLSTYPGAVGVKTGYTEASGHSLVAAARRGGRTLIAVVIDSPNPDAVAAALLDSAFATPAPAATAKDRLPPRPSDTTAPARPAAAPTVHQAAIAVSHDPPGLPSLVWLVALGAAAVLCVATGLLLRRATALHRRGVRRLQGPTRRRHPTWPGRRPR
jgi:D-alanyl-D-alanine carboxypeptidase